MKKLSLQPDLPVAGVVFNLASERGIDPERVVRETAAARAARIEAEAYREKMQGKLAMCPGFVGCYPPASVDSPGKVTVQPSAVDDAVDFLKRRFVVGEVGWKKGFGFTVEILPRSRRSGLRPSQRLAKSRAQQFELAFESTTR